RHRRRRRLGPRHGRHRAVGSRRQAGTPRPGVGGGVMRLGIFAKTFAGTGPSAVLAAAKAAGFYAVQYNMACSGLPPMPDAIPADVVAAVASASQEEDVPICAVSGTYNMAHPDPAVRAAGLRRLEVLAAACGGMGTRLITLCTGTRDPDDQWR